MQVLYLNLVNIFLFGRDKCDSVVIDFKMILKDFIKLKKNKSVRNIICENYLAGKGQNGFEISNNVQHEVEI